MPPRNTRGLFGAEVDHVYSPRYLNPTFTNDLASFTSQQLSHLNSITFKIHSNGTQAPCPLKAWHLGHHILCSARGCNRAFYIVTTAFAYTTYHRRAVIGGEDTKAGLARTFATSAIFPRT